MEVSTEIKDLSDSTNLIYCIENIDEAKIISPSSMNDIGIRLYKKNCYFIDLFAGAGGLSEGFYKEDSNSLLHAEIDMAACETLRERMRYYKYSDEKVFKSVICGDF